nr:zinc finger, CCHC-type [Tanacetum cinerariifolium]
MLVVRERGLRTKTKVDAIAWWIDSGATTHVCKDRCWFKTFDLVEDRSVLYMGDEHFTPVHGKGSVALEFRHVHYKRMLEMSKDDLIPAIDESQEKCTTCCKWIFKRNMKVDGTIDKFKARLITFLNGDLDEEVYMKQPEGFVMSGNEHKVCKLVKSLYGLKQAPKQCHKKFDEVVLSSGFHLNQFDNCVYSKFDNFGLGVIICLYVDDMLILGTDQNQVDKTKKFLSLRFSMKDMGEADVILGIKIRRENKGIVITQSHYIEKILKKFIMKIVLRLDPVENLKANTKKPIDQLGYSRAIGCLVYGMTSTRLNIANVVGRLSRFTSIPNSYSDASWINHVEDSSSGWVFMLGGGAISWASKKQTCITGLTMESEVVALVTAGKEA